MEEGKSAVMPLSCSLQFTTEQTFKMKYYIASLNSRYFQKYKRSNLKEQKINPYKSLLRRIYFLFLQIRRLVFLDPLGCRKHNVPHFKCLFRGKMETTAQGRDMVFTFLHPLLKSTILEGTSLKILLVLCCRKNC